MTISLSKKVQSAIAMTLTMVGMISPADAQTVSCTSSSPQCCWVVLSWQKMGKTTSVDHNNATACCKNRVSAGIPGVQCTPTGIVAQIDWHGQSLQGSIPPELATLSSIFYL